MIGGGACAANLYYKLLKLERISKKMAHVTNGSSIVAAINAAVSKMWYCIFSSCMQRFEVAFVERSVALFVCLH